MSLNKSKSAYIKSMLLVDDDENLIELFRRLIREEMKLEFVYAKYPTQSINYSLENLFDLIFIDVSINFNGSPFGGFEIYKSLINRYGDSSLIAYSKYITDDLLKQYNYNFNFIEKGNDPVKFIEKMSRLGNSLRKNQKCFVAMPFEEKYDKVYDTIRKCVEKESFRCVRLDKQFFNKSVIQKVFDEIKNCKFLIFVATGQNPNAYYECGFANALEKEIITVTDHYENLPFDIRDRNAIAYKDDLRDLEKSLSEKLRNLTIVNVV